jgi:uncharacterized damage-inducible protein DinB
MNKTRSFKTNRQALFLQRLSEAKDRLLQAIAGLDEATLAGERVVGDWTVKDILGHVVSWNDEFRADILAILKGQHPGFDHRIDQEDDFNTWNQVQFEKKRTWTWQRIRQDLDRDYREASNLILSLRQEDYRKRGVTPWKPVAVEKTSALSRTDTESVETLVTYHWRHMNEHTRMLEKWRKSR